MSRGGYPRNANMNNMLKQVQKMQKEMEKAQAELESTEFSSTAGGGVIEAVVDGKKTLKKITIDPDVVDPEDVEMLEDLVVAAVNDAMKKVDNFSAEKMGKLTGGMNIPGL